MASGNSADSNLHYKMYMSNTYNKDDGKKSIINDVNL